jgi:hypothetical protein
MRAERVSHADACRMESHVNNQWLFDESTENFKRHWTRVESKNNTNIIDFQVDGIDTKHVYGIDTHYSHSTPTDSGFA